MMKQICMLSWYFPPPRDLVTNLALPPTAWNDNFDFPGLETWDRDARRDSQHRFHLNHDIYHPGTSCSVCSTMWTMRTRYFDGCNYHYYHYFYKVAFRGMQALNTSGILELMENLGSSGECQVHFGPFQRYKWSNLYIFTSARFTLVKDINLLVVSILTSGSFVESTSKLLQDKR